MIKDCDYLFKVVVVGDSSVGKSSLLNRFTDGVFQESYLATIGVDFRFKSLNINDREVKLQIWDTAGQQRFRTITSAYYRGAHAILIVYDGTNTASYDSILNFWLLQLEKYGEPNTVVGLVANKTDCTPVVDEALSTALCVQKSFQFHKVSAKTGEGVKELFEAVSKKLTEIHPPIQRKQQEINSVVANVMKKKQEFKIQSGANTKQQNKKCC